MRTRLATDVAGRPSLEGNRRKASERLTAEFAADLFLAELTRG
jgi:hypothetical protein